MKTSPRPLPSVLAAEAELEALRGPSDLPRGWSTVIRDLTQDLDALGLYPLRLCSDFAELRCAVGPEGDERARSPQAQPVVESAAWQSAHTCQECGRAGTQKWCGRWLTVLCRGCWAVELGAQRV